MEEPRVDQEVAAGTLENKPNSGEDLMSAFATAEIPPDVSDTPQHETQITGIQHAMAEDSESSTSSSRRQSGVEDYLQIDGGRQTGAKSASSRSSLSSIPDSVLVHPKEQSMYGRDRIGEIYEEQEEDFAPYGDQVYQKIRDRNSPFRHPSSVKAIQMQTEDEEDEEIMSPSRRKAALFRGSPASVRSLGSPLARRHGYHSAGNTPRRSSPIKKENPLVLLHCTVLQPTVILGPGMSLPERQVLEKVLPPLYARRWKLLEEKISGSGLLRDRGLLIQHPQEDYGLLEERLLESLELQKPRLENGHYNNHEASDSENESGEEKSEHPSSNDKGHCVDCGCHVNHRDDRRKWDVKFYAANGLMKEGAWTAAWKEIERVDVQISLWLPYEVKSEVEKKIKEEIAVAAELEKMKAAELIVQEPQPSRQDIISQDQIDGLDDRPDMTKSISKQQRRERQALEREFPACEPARPRKRDTDTDLHTLIIKSIRVLASDKRNIITIISLLIAILAVVFGGRATRRSQYGYDKIHFGEFPAVSTQVYHTSSTSSVLTQASTEVPICESESRVERAGEVQRVVEGVLDEQKPKVVVQSAVLNSEKEILSEPVQDETIEIPVDHMVETISITIPDAAYRDTIMQPDESKYDSAEAEVDYTAASGDGPTDTQEDGSAIVESTAPTIMRDDNHVAAQVNDLNKTQDSDTTITQSDDYTISQSEEPVITRGSDRITAPRDSSITQDFEVVLDQIENPAVTQEVDSTTNQDDGATINENEPPAIADNDRDAALNDDSIVAQDDDCHTLNTGIEERAIVNVKHIISQDADPMFAEANNHVMNQNHLSTPQHNVNETAE